MEATARAILRHKTDVGEKEVIQAGPGTERKGPNHTKPRLLNLEDRLCPVGTWEPAKGFKQNEVIRTVS